MWIHPGFLTSLQGRTSVVCQCIHSLTKTHVFWERELKYPNKSDMVIGKICWNTQIIIWTLPGVPHKCLLNLIYFDVHGKLGIVTSLQVTLCILFSTLVLQNWPELHCGKKFKFVLDWCPIKVVLKFYKQYYEIRINR